MTYVTIKLMLHHRQRLPDIRLVIATVIAVATTGILLLVASRAAGPFVSTEPELGALSGQATKITDSSASGGAAVQFKAAPSQFLFGIGTELDGDLNQRLVKEAPVKLLTSWYNGPNDLGFMTGWKSTLIPQAYAAGYSLHLIVWTGDSEQNITTKYGPACGRPYPLSAGFTSDMQQLATAYKGTGPLYVSLFTEFQTYPCQDNNWLGSENYYMALKDQYLATMQIFHQYAPNSKVSLSWGGWQASYDDPAKGGGKSLFPYFADVMSASDFQSFQAMDSTSNLADITDMTEILHAYGPVMLAHYKPDNGSQATWDADMDIIFTPSNMAQLQQNGLFAFSFMDNVNMNSSEAAYQKAKTIVQTYAH